MPFWFLDNQQRLADERVAIQQLEASAEWLRGVHWHWESDGLSVNAVIHAHGYDYQVRMEYPQHFPAIPPTVRPQDPDALWSGHQYLSGVLCLEWGPDTWHPQTTGAQVLESAYRLLCTENPLGVGPKQIVPSRHQPAIGQTLRTTKSRFYIGTSLTAHLASLPRNGQGQITFSFHLRPKSWLVLVSELESADGTQCKDSAVPQGMRSDKLHKGCFVCTNLEPTILQGCEDLDQLQAVLQSDGGTFTPENGFQAETDSIGGILVLDATDQPHFFLLYGLGTEPLKAHRFTRIAAPGASAASRIPIHLQNLSGKKVGIVGLGSAGSKIALSLARTGLNAFMLIDFDIVLPENLCRNTSDWRDLGEHKVDALAHQLSYIAPDIQVEVSCLHLTGQESPAALNGVMSRLATCDLLIDATASPAVFNLLAAVTVDSHTPLLWMEVYAGGIGGMVARSRPDQDPDPHTMRLAYLSALPDFPLLSISEPEDYSLETSEGEILVATDADVSIVAGFATKLALDILAGGEPSRFPHSLYLLGLAQAWLFQAPFHTIPIATDHLRGDLRPNALQPEMTTETVRFLSEILNRAKDADSSS